MHRFKRALYFLQSVASAFLLLVANIIKNLTMPRGNSKRKKNAAKETVTSTAGQLDNVRPPNPEESNLVARDPFDDAPKPSPGMQMRMVHPSFHPGQPMPRMVSHAPMGASYREMPGMRPGFGYSMGPHHFPGGHIGMVRSPSYSGHPSCPNGYPMSRVPYMAYRQRMINGIRPGMPGGPMSDGVIEHGMIGGPGAHLGPMGRPTLTAIRRQSTGSSKNSAVDGKSPKIEPSAPKSKKKNDKKSSSIKTEDVKPMNGMDGLGSGNATPTPAAPKTCRICNQEIAVGEDMIQCKASCGMYFHKTCTGLTDAAYKFLITEEIAIWCCDFCIKSNIEINAFCPSQKVKNSPTPLSAGA